MNRKKPLKILHVVGAMNVGGTESMLMSIFRNVNPEEMQFDFITYGNEKAYFDGEIQRLGGRVIRLRNKTSIWQLYNAIRDFGPYDAVHSHTLFHSGIVNLTALLAGVKVRVAHAHTTLDNEEGWIRKLYVTTMRQLINFGSTHLLACSKAAGKYMFGNRSISKLKYTYFPNLIDYKKFMNPQQTKIKKMRLEAGIGNSIVIGHIGRFVESKNHKQLLVILKDILQKNASAKLMLVGDGELKPKIMELAKKDGLQDHIIFMGMKNDIFTVLPLMHVFVFPSKFEGLGLVLLEAQAAGIQCVVSEAIQPEADMGLGLIHKLSLDEDSDVWANKVLDLVGKKETNQMKIKEKFEKNSQSINMGIKKLIDIYKFDNGEAYDEKSVDRLI